VYGLAKIQSLHKLGILPKRKLMKPRDHHREWLRTKSRIAIRYQFLVIKLGGKCRKCQAVENLELDHPEGKDWEARKLSPQMRMKRYEQDFENGKLSLLCVNCNRKDGALNKNYYKAVRNGEDPGEKIPF
jgi:hypothetical protein